MLNFGGFLASNFWTNYRCQSSAAIDDLLNNKNCTVDKLLDEDDCLQEFKNHNEKLIKFFDHEKLKILIDFITVMPDKEDGHNRGRKYPFITGEIFNCEINQILDKFFEAPPPVQLSLKGDDDEVEKEDKEDDEEEEDDEKKSDKDDETVITSENDGSKDTEASKESDEAAAPQDAQNESNGQIATETEEKKQTQEPESEEQAEGVKSEKKQEPEGEDTASIDKQSETLTTQAQSTLITETPDEIPEDKSNQYALLDRLFTFLDTNDDEQLNPVLSGYFSRLVSLLISRKQKDLIPYVFAPESQIMDHLVKHVYQKSVSEILNKLLTQVDSNFDDELKQRIKIKQQQVTAQLINYLGPQYSQEHNLNARNIIQDLFEFKDLFNVISRRENVNKLANFAIVPISEGSKSSKSESLVVLNLYIQNCFSKQKKADQKGGRDDDKSDDNKNQDEDGDIIVRHNSDDETNEDGDAQNPNSVAHQTNMLVDILKEKVDEIAKILEVSHPGSPLTNSVTDTPFIPLGPQRLYTADLVLHMLKMRKPTLYQAIIETKSLYNILELVKTYPWNNFLQLISINIFEEILNNCDNQQVKRQLLECSGIGEALVAMSNEAKFQMDSGRNIRNGFMGLCVRLANQLNSKTENAGINESDLEIIDYLDKVESWQDFKDGELASSNENNKKILGGSVNRNNDEEEDKDDNNYDVQMEKIMARFTNFNQIISNSNSNDDDDEEEETDNTVDEANSEEKDGGFDEDDADAATDNILAGKNQDNQVIPGLQIQKVDLKEPQPLEVDYIDSSYWKVPEQKPEEMDIDSLLADYE